MRTFLFACALALPALAALPAAIAPAQAQGDVIATRKEGLKRMGAEIEAIKNSLDRGEPVAPLAARAQAMAGFFQTLPGLFPPGSDQGDTRARPTVWSDRAGFETASANMVAALGKLQQAAASGDAGATATAFREAGATCGACHRAYRSR
ncbi:c-type cytochrome [Pseudoroseomonas cervicalis]|uniref:c-type cytochrome n=1 Tax=Teichococcus cervicalis TaxID=204525 RepID=UPI000687356C|nr:cytochrome c [Pseudoroseomonas cervicalis]